jgi:hypothetical protein
MQRSNNLILYYCVERMHIVNAHTCLKLQKHLDLRENAVTKLQGHFLPVLELNFKTKLNYIIL